MSPEELEAVNRLRARLEWGQDVATDQELLDTLAGQRELLAVQLDQLWRAMAFRRLGELAHRLLTWRGWRW